MDNYSLFTLFLLLLGRSGVYELYPTIIQILILSLLWISPQGVVVSFLDLSQTSGVLLLQQYLASRVAVIKEKITITKPFGHRLQFLLDNYPGLGIHSWQEIFFAVLIQNWCGLSLNG